MNSSNEIKSTRTTFELLETLKEKNEATLAELTEEFDLSKSSVHNYLNTLRKDGYVTKEGNRYRVGLKFLNLGGHARRRERIYATAKQEVTALAKETGEMTNLVVETRGKGIYLHRAHGENAVKTDSYIGQQIHLHNTALGKAILAYLPEERVDEIIDQHGLPRSTENTITDRDALFDELERVRERDGIAFNKEEQLRGVRAVGAPVQDANGTVIGALSVSGPTHRMKGARLNEEMPDMVLGTANELELGIEYA